MALDRRNRGCGVAVTAAFVRALGQLFYFTLEGLDVASRRGIVQQQTDFGKITAQRIDGRAAPWPPDLCTLPRNTRFHCRIRVLDRVQRSPNGRYEAGKRRSTVDGGPDPRCSFCRPGKDAVKTCGHAASSRNKGTRMAGPKNPGQSLKQRPSMPSKGAGWVPGPCGSEGSPTSAFRAARPRRAL